MSSANKQRLIKAAREAGFSDAEILQEVLRGEYGSERRRRLVVEWGELLGLTVSDSEPVVATCLKHPDSLG